MDDVNIDDLDEEVHNDWDEFVTGRNCIIFIIDARKDMFSNHDGDSLFVQCIKCCKESMLNIARKQQNDLVGVVLCGTKLAEGKNAPDGVVLLQPLCVPSSSKVNNLKEIIDDDCKDVKSKYGHSDDFNLGEVLHYSQSLIHSSTIKMYIKNLVLFTFDDNPHSDSPTLQHRARKQVEDFLLNEIEFDVIGLGSKFDSSLFYKELVLTSRGELLKDWKNKDPIKNLDEFKGQFDKFTDKFSRRLSFLHLGDGYKLNISLYKLYSEPKKFVTKQVHEKAIGADNFNANSETINAHCESQMQHYNQMAEEKFLKVPFIGGRHIDISKSQLNNFLEKKYRGFDVMSFYPTENIPLYLSVAAPYFIIPFGKNENNNLVFSHLHKSCLQRGLSIFCWFNLTKASNPSFCALHPVNAAQYAKGREHPPGFIVTRIPYSDSLLEPEEIEDVSSPSDKQLNAARSIVNKLTIPYTVDMFSDAEIRTRIAMIEALALEYDDVQEIDDDTDIDLDEIAQTLGSLNLEFMDCSHIEEEEPAGKASKRPAQFPESSRNASKIQKTDNPIKMIKDGLAHKMTVAQLREVLKAEGIKSVSALNKPTLIAIANQKFFTK